MFLLLTLTAQASPTECVKTLYTDLRLFASAENATKVAKLTCADGLDLATYRRVRDQMPGDQLTQQHLDAAVQAAAGAHTGDCVSQLTLDVRLFASESAARQVASSTCTAGLDLAAYRRVRDEEPGLALTQVGFDRAVRAGSAAAARPQAATPSWSTEACGARLQPVYAESFGQSKAQERSREECATPFDLEIFDVVLPRYRQSFSASQAVDRSLEKARIPEVSGNLAVVEWAYQGYSESFSASRAMDEAVERARVVPADHLPVLEWAFSRYRRSLSSSTAVDRAVDATTTLDATHLACLNRTFPTYESRFSSDAAVDRSIEDCRD